MDADTDRGDGGARGCPKCGHTDTEVDSMTTTDGLLNTVINVPDEGFTVVSCQNCGYSELYRHVDSDGNDARDLFLG